MFIFKLFMLWNTDGDIMLILLRCLWHKIYIFVDIKCIFINYSSYLEPEQSAKIDVYLSFDIEPKSLW